MGYQPTDNVPGKSYTWGDMVQVQSDFEKSRLGGGLKSTERTRQMGEAINAEQAKRREAGK